MTKLTTNQKLALVKLGSNSFSFDIPNVTLNSLVRSGLIKRIGDYYHVLTDAGVRVLVEIRQEAVKKIDL